MNIIGKMALFFTGDNAPFFHKIYADWDRYWVRSLEEATDRILKKFDHPTRQIEIDNLDIQLQPLTAATFHRFFIQQYEEALEDALYASIHKQNMVKPAKQPTKTRSALLFDFLRHGSLAWKADSVKDLNALFLEVAANDHKALRTFLKTYGHYTSLQQRLVFQFDEQVLRTGIRVVAPSDSHFILSYVDWIQQRHKTQRHPPVSHTAYKQVSWQVLYAYLLTNRSSFFNKKSFIKQTIKQLANQYLLVYTELLHTLIQGDAFDRAQFPMELLTLLKTLKDEDEKTIREETDWQIWLKFLKPQEQHIPTLLKKEMDMLVKLLTSTNNKLIIQLFNEQQLLKIVETLIPQHYTFIKSYTNTLTQKKEQGLLQGKAGNEFRLVKWQLIFPILLDEQATAFNRHHFVELVLRKIAGHYNLYFSDLVRYFYDIKHLRMIDKELQEIFSQLYQRLQSEEYSDKSESLAINNTDDLISQLRTTMFNNVAQTESWLRLLKHENNRHQLVTQLSEREHQHVIERLYVQEHRFILAYASLIDRQQNLVQGKTSAHHKTIKWQFIYAVLMEPQQQVFNKRYFVESILKKLAAHHNLKIETLTAFLFVESTKIGNSLPFDLLKMVETIYQEQQKKDKSKSTPPLTKTDSPQEGYTLLQAYFGEEEALRPFFDKLVQRPDFLRYIESIIPIEYRLRMYIVNKLGVSIEKKQVLLLLLQLSKNYTTYSKVAIVQKLIALFFNSLKTTEQITAFTNKIKQAASENTLVKESLSAPPTIVEAPEVYSEEIDDNPNREEDFLFTYIENAGLVLVAPFLPRLFSLLRLTESGKFIDTPAQVRAIFCIQYLVFNRTDFPEFELTLNKLLCGFKTGAPIPSFLQLTDHEIETLQQLREGIISHWHKVRTQAGLCEGFLQRPGKIMEHMETIEILVESRAYDMLLDSIPWNFRTIKFSWMDKPIQVKWR